MTGSSAGSVGSEAMVVGVCTYNRGGAISRTLDAIAGMDRVGGRITRLVVVDNRCTDDTAPVVDAFAALCGSIPVQRVYEPEQGKIAAMKRLFAETTEPLVGILDDDCVPDPGWGSAMIARFDACPRAGAVGGPVRNIWESGPTPLAEKYRQSLGFHDRGMQPLRLDGAGEFIIGASMAVRRAAVEECGWIERCELAARTGSDLECGAEDAEVCIRVRQAGWEIWYEPAAAVGHLIPARRQTREYLARVRGAICRGEPKLKWLAAGKPGATWVLPEYRRARATWIKTLLLDWRPSRRAIRLAERAGRLEGWRRLVREMEGPARD